MRTTQPTADAETVLDRYPRLGRLYDQVTGDEDTRVCKDIPESACTHLPRNFFAYLLSNVLTKIADELASARLILPWLLGAVGAPVAFTGFLVPVREAGVLLPQLFVAAYIRRLARRKGVWILGAVLCAGALVVMAPAGAALQGTAAGGSLLALLAMFSLARGLCSVSAKDVLGKTVSKTRRGALMGYSASASGLITLLIGAYIEMFASETPGVRLLFAFLLLAAGAMIVAAGIFSVIEEEPGATEGGGNAIQVALTSLALLRNDHDFRRFITARLLLLSVALAPPFYVLLAQQRLSGVTGLGLLIVASGLASSLSAPIWGRMSDRSSRTVMVVAATAAGCVGITTSLLDLGSPALMSSAWTYAILFLMVAVCHGGVRLGRKVYLVDMATVGNRSAYVAVSNTVIGAAMLGLGAVGVLGDIAGTRSVILVLSVVACVAALYISRMPEVSA